MGGWAGGGGGGGGDEAYGLLFLKNLLKNIFHFIKVK